MKSYIFNEVELENLKRQIVDDVVEELSEQLKNYFDEFKDMLSDTLADVDDDEETEVKESETECDSQEETCDFNDKVDSLILGKSVEMNESEYDDLLKLLHDSEIARYRVVNENGIITLKL